MQSSQNQNQMYKNIIDSKVFPFLFEEENFSEIKEKNYLCGKIVTAICILCFDDEIGQIAENVYPTDIFNKEMIKSISGLGFPETNSIHEDGEIQYFFKIRQSKQIL